MTSAVPVLIVGGGPAGLTTAITLARHGVRSLLVERRSRPSGLPRATAVSTRSMELMRSFGVEDEIRAGGVEVDWTAWVTETLATAPTGHAMPTGLPTREASRLVSPTTPAAVPQDHLEPVLLRHLRTLEPARVEMATELLELRPDGDGYRTVLRDVGTGRTRIVRARYVVGADGAHSAVRAALGITTNGPGEVARGVSAVFRAPLWDLVGEHRHGIYGITHPEAEGVLLPAGHDDRWVYGFRSDAGQDRHLGVTEARLEELIRLAVGVSSLEPRIERTGGFGYTALLADRFRLGDAFLVGDAAHRVTPRGGTGMNTAIHDGHDLGWRLGWVFRGWARPALLDGYERERRPVAEHNVRRSADADGSWRHADQELHADLGGRVPHVWVPSGRGPVSSLDLLGSGLTLFTGPDRAAWDAAVADVPGPLPVRVRSLDRLPTRALGVRGDGALLVRPDAAPAGWFGEATDAAAGLRAAVARVRADEDHSARTPRRERRAHRARAFERPVGQLVATGRT